MVLTWVSQLGTILLTKFVDLVLAVGSAQALLCGGMQVLVGLKNMSKLLMSLQTNVGAPMGDSQVVGTLCFIDDADAFGSLPYGITANVAEQYGAVKTKTNFCCAISEHCSCSY